MVEIPIIQINYFFVLIFFFILTVFELECPNKELIGLDVGVSQNAEPVKRQII